MVGGRRSAKRGRLACWDRRGYLTSLRSTVALFVGISTGFFVPQASFVGAVAVADLVKSTLGPKGMVGGQLQPAPATVLLRVSLRGGGR